MSGTGYGFTPGPWRFSEIWRPPVGNFNSDEPRNAEGNIFWGYSITGSNEHGGMILPTLACVHNFPTQMEANARAIAALPELVEALESCSHALRSYQYGNGHPALAESTADHTDAILSKLREGSGT